MSSKLSKFIKKWQKKYPGFLFLFPKYAFGSLMEFLPVSSSLMNGIYFNSKGIGIGESAKHNVNIHLITGIVQGIAFVYLLGYQSPYGGFTFILQKSLHIQQKYLTIFILLFSKIVGIFILLFSKIVGKFFLCYWYFKHIHCPLKQSPISKLNIIIGFSIILFTQYFFIFSIYYVFYNISYSIFKFLQKNTDSSLEFQGIFCTLKLLLQLLLWIIFFFFPNNPFLKLVFIYSGINFMESLLVLLSNSYALNNLLTFFSSACSIFAFILLFYLQDKPLLSYWILIVIHFCFFKLLNNTNENLGTRYKEKSNFLHHCKREYLLLITGLLIYFFLDLSFYLLWIFRILFSSGYWMAIFTLIFISPILFLIKKQYKKLPNPLVFSIFIYLVTTVIFGIVWFLPIKTFIPLQRGYILLGIMNSLAIIPGISRMMVHFISGFALSIPMKEIIILNYLMSSVTSLGQWILYKEDLKTSNNDMGFSGNISNHMQQIKKLISLKIQNLMVFFSPNNYGLNLVALIILTILSFFFLWIVHNLLQFSFFWSFLIIIRLLVALYLMYICFTNPKKQRKSLFSIAE